MKLLGGTSEKGSDKPQEPSLGTVLVKEGYTIEKIVKAVEVNSSAKKVNIHLLDLRKRLLETYEG